jgi:hypothetical protein
MVRVEDLDITFFHMPKNAGSSIEKWLQDNLDADVYLDDLRHASPDSLRPMFGDFGWSFCCVRNPWDRMVSWYNFFRGQGKIHTCFEDWMDACFDPSQTTAKYIKPINTQMRFVDEVDYVIRYENLVEDFKIVQEKTNCFDPLGHHNSSKRKPKYLDYYTNDDHISMVGEYFYKEIKELGYEYGK